MHHDSICCLVQVLLDNIKYVLSVTKTKTISLYLGGQTRRKLLSVLQSIDFKQSYPEFPTLDVVDPVLVERCLALCEQKNARGVALCNVKKLHRMLISELSSQHGASVTSHRSPYNLVCESAIQPSQ